MSQSLLGGGLGGSTDLGPMACMRGTRILLMVVYSLLQSAVQLLQPIDTAKDRFWELYMAYDAVQTLGMWFALVLDPMQQHVIVWQAYIIHAIRRALIPGREIILTYDLHGMLKTRFVCQA